MEEGEEETERNLLRKEKKNTTKKQNKKQKQEKKQQQQTLLRKRAANAQLLKKMIKMGRRAGLLPQQRNLLSLFPTFSLERGVGADFLILDLKGCVDVFVDIASLFSRGSILLSECVIHIECSF